MPGSRGGRVRASSEVCLGMEELQAKYHVAMRSCLCLGLLFAFGCGCHTVPTGGPATLGATLRNPSSESGPVLVDLDEEGPAARAGLRPGDRLVSLDGMAVASDCA